VNSRRKRILGGRGLIVPKREDHTGRSLKINKLLQKEGAKGRLYCSIAKNKK
jgi:hypothetical protein